MSATTTTSNTSTADVVIIGGGVVGCGLASELSKYKGLRIVLLERCETVSSGTSKANSGIVHAGTDTTMATMKGRLVHRGNELIHKAYPHLHFGFHECGGLVVAQDEADMKGLMEEYEIGKQKGIPVEIWDQEKVQKEEPALVKTIIKGLYTPTTSVINPYEFCFALAACATQNGAEIKCLQKVVGIDKNADDAKYPLTVRTDKQLSIKARFVVNAAGVYTGLVSEMVGIMDVKITPRKGEEYLLDKNVTYSTKRVVHPVPTPTTKGILLIPTVDKTMMVGPTADYVSDFEDTSTSTEGAAKVFAAARKLCPLVHERDIIASFAGLRAACMPLNDFILGKTAVKGFIQAAGIQSPGLTCALSIAEYLTNECLAKEGLELVPKENWLADIEPMPKFCSQPLEKQIEMAKNPAFSKIVCRCEVVTEGDILAAVKQGANTLDGIKLRTRAGCGRCQGGFCTSRVLEVLSEKLGVPVDKICKNSPASTILLGASEQTGFNVERPLIPDMRHDFTSKIDVLVVGSGPAGLSAAVGAKEAGAKRVVVLDRESFAGGILLQCIHSGFGLHAWKKEMTGPEYAEECQNQALAKGVEIVQNAFVIHAENKAADQKEVYALVAGYGLIKIEASSLILAMGARERTRPQIKIPGARPAGVMTAGLAQKMINMHGKLPGKKCVILGSGDIGLIMARRLALNGVEVAGVFEVLPTCSGLNRNVVQCLHDFNIPMHLSHTITRIHGKDRVTGVSIAPVGPPPTFTPDMTKQYDIECDTVLLSVGLIPENELSMNLGVSLDPMTRGAIVNDSLMTNVPGIFCCGNVLHVHDLADNCFSEGHAAGGFAGQYVLKNTPEGQKTPVINLKKGEGINYVIPQLVKMPQEGEIKEDDKVSGFTISMRVSCAMRPATIKIGDFVTKPMKIAFPGEMIRFKVLYSDILAWHKRCPTETLITVCAQGTPIPREVLQSIADAPQPRTPVPGRPLPMGSPAEPRSETVVEEPVDEHYICLGCPNGCMLTLTHKGKEVIGVVGNKCKIGDKYARDEFVEPKRVFSMTVSITGAALEKLPVKLATPIPKDRLFEAAAIISKLETKAPIKMGDVILKDLLGIKGADVIACRSLALAQ